MKRICLSVVIALIATLTYTKNYGQGKNDTYYVKITEPTNGFSVGRQCKINGTANIPSGDHLWVLCHRSDFPKWWAQSAPVIAQNSWRATVYIGEAQDIGEDFEIVAIVVNATTDAQLRATYGQAIDLPDSDYRSLITVHKINHQ